MGHKQGENGILQENGKKQSDRGREKPVSLLSLIGVDEGFWVLGECSGFGCKFVRFLRRSLSHAAADRFIVTTLFRQQQKNQTVCSDLISACSWKEVALRLKRL